VPAELGLLVEEGNCRLGFDLQQSAGDRDAEDPTADDSDSPPHSPPDGPEILAAGTAQLGAGGPHRRMMAERRRSVGRTYL
jgi:hypothetical protein